MLCVGLPRVQVTKNTENAFKGLGPRPAFKEDLCDKGTNWLLWYFLGLNFLTLKAVYG